MGGGSSACSSVCSNKTQLNQQMVPDTAHTRVRFEVDDDDQKKLQFAADMGMSLRTTTYSKRSLLSPEKSKSRISKSNLLSAQSSYSTVQLSSQQSTHKYVRMNTDYNANCVVQSAAASDLESWVNTCAIQLENSGMLGKNQNLQFCEFGCATGGDSIGILQATIDGLDEAAGNNRSVSAVMNDLPLNNWEVCSTTLEPEFSPRIKFTYSKQCMYEREIVDKPGVMHLGVSTFAQHWLRKGVPSPLPPDAVWGNQLPLGDKRRLLWEQAAQRDWTRFLELRANEFCSGGFLLLHIQSSLLDGGLSEVGAATLAQAKAELLKEGLLTQSESAVLAMPEYAKSTAEILDVLRTPTMMRLWVLKDMRFLEQPCPYGSQEAVSPSSVENRKTMVKEAVDVLRSFMKASVVSKIGENKAVLFFQRTEQIAGSDVSRIALNVSTTFLRLQRRA